MLIMFFVALCMFTVLALLILFGRRYLKRKKELDAKILIHRSRSRQIYGCITCGGSNLMRCGTCVEETTQCLKCFKISPHNHRMFLEPVYWEVEYPPTESLRCCAQVLTTAFQVFAERRLLGWRQELPDGTRAHEYSWLTYSQVESRVSRLAGGLASLGVSRGSLVPLIASSCVDWYLLQYALIYMGAVPVCLHSNVSETSLVEIFQRAPPVVICISKHLVHLLDKETVVPIILMDDEADAYPHSDHQEGLGSFRTVIELCTNFARVPVCLDRESQDVAVLLSTSGSSGTPKLVIVTESMLLTQVKPARVGRLMVLLAQQPLRQSLDILCKGASFGVFSGSLDRIHEDCRLLRPTVFGSTPLFWQSMHEQYMRAPDKQEWKGQQPLGNRCKMAIIGGAKSSPELRKWIFITFGCNVLDGYGCTEAGGLAANSSVHNAHNIQLVDAPELGYTTDDKPFPRGEIIATSRRLSPGYYGDDKATESAFFTSEGTRYFRTGDIGCLKNGCITVIDRRSSLFKLSNGVYVAPAPLEAIFSQSPLVNNVFVWGNDSYVVVCCQSSADSVQILKSVRELARVHELPAWEIPQRVIVDPEPWTVWNGLLVSIGKLSRSALKRRFKEKIGVSNSEFVPPPSSVSVTGVSAGIISMLCELMPGLDPAALSATDSLAMLGANSLILVNLASTIKERYNKELTLPQLARMESLVHLQQCILGEGPAGASRPLLVDWNAKVDHFWNLVERADPVVTQRPFIFLTGATGYLGAFLLASVLQHYPGSPVVCLVRAKDNDAARTRLDSTLERFLLELDLTHVKCICGDLTLPKFGLSEEKWSQLKGQVSLVIHNAAVVNSTSPYTALEAPNVMGTVTALSLCRNVHYISTIGLTGGSGVSEEAPCPPTALGNLTGYAQSKWVAEQLACRARALVFRPGTMAPASASGAFNPNDSVYLMLSGINALHALCVEEDSPLPQNLMLLSVDIAADAIVKIGKKSQSSGVYHIINVRATRLDTLVPADIPRVSSQQFSDMCACLPADHPLAILGFKSGAKFGSSSTSACSDTRVKAALGDDWKSIHSQ